MELTKQFTKSFTYEKNGTKLSFGLLLDSKEPENFLECLKQAVIDVEKEIKSNKNNK